MRQNTFIRPALALALAFLLGTTAGAASSDYKNYRQSDGTPQAVMLSFYDGPTTRGFTWQTATSVTSGSVWLRKGDFTTKSDIVDSVEKTATATTQSHSGDCTTYKANVSGLTDGLWSYCLGNGDNVVLGQFTVTSTPTGPITIVNLNDIQTKVADELTHWQNTVSAIASQLGSGTAADFILSGGDFIDGTVPESQTKYVSWGVIADQANANAALKDAPWIMVSGNHDTALYDELVGENFYQTSDPAGCHAFNYGNVHIATIPYASSLSSNVKTWLENDLASDAAQNARWRVVMMHYGPYTTADHGRDASSSYVTGVSTIMKDGKVDLVLQGHDHTYSKTWPYRWSGAGYTGSLDDTVNVNLSPALTNIDNVAYYLNPEGTYYVSAGCAGHRVGENPIIASSTYNSKRTTCLTVISTNCLTGASASQDLSQSMFGVLTVDGDKLAYDWYTVSDSGAATHYDTLRVCKAEVGDAPEPVDPPSGGFLSADEMMELVTVDGGEATCVDDNTALLVQYKTVGTGSLTIPGGYDATAEILVVGGGGSGGYAAKKSSGYYGSGGNGGEVKKDTRTISAGEKLTITVGAGGTGSDSATDPGDASTIVGDGDFGTMTANGGSAGVSSKSSTSGSLIDGKGNGGQSDDRTGVSWSITGETYGAGGRKGNGTDPSPAVGGANTGDGGGGATKSSSSSATSGKSGGSGIVIVKITSLKRDLPTVIDFKGAEITVRRATVTTNAPSGDLVLTFKKNGTLGLSQDVLADVLVVGGGGSGAASRSSSSGYQGNGGGGAQSTYKQEETLPSGCYTATVGAGGPNQKAPTDRSVQYVDGTKGGDSVFSNGASLSWTGAGGAAGSGGNKNTSSAGPGGPARLCSITGSDVTYGEGGSAGSKVGTRGNAAAQGADGEGDGGGGGYGGVTGKGGDGVVIVRLKGVVAPREPMSSWPTVATGLVYDGTVQTGVSTEEICQFTGTWAATDAGDYTATVTPATGYCWPDGTYGATNISWSIAKRPVTVSVVATNKVVGAEEPLYPTRAEGFVDDDAEISWKVWRTNLVEQADGSFGLDEEIGTYDLVIVGSTDETTNYTITYVNGVGAFEIRQAGPVIVDPDDPGDPTTGPTIKPAEGTNGVYVVETKTEETKTVEIGGLQPTDVVIVPEQIDTVVGVAATQIVVVAEATNATGTVKVNITDAFTITENNVGVTIALNTDPAAEVVVEIKGKEPETIKVTPEFGTSADTVVGEQPLVVDDENVSVGVKTIPGLKYTLLSGETVTTIETEVETVVAKDTRVVLEAAKTADPSKFYKVEVRK